jgi:hypothetical protein
MDPLWRAELSNGAGVFERTLAGIGLRAGGSRNEARCAPSERDARREDVTLGRRMRRSRRRPAWVGRADAVVHAFLHFGGSPCITFDCESQHALALLPLP